MSSRFAEHAYFVDCLREAMGKEPLYDRSGLYKSSAERFAARSWPWPFGDTFPSGQRKRANPDY